MKHSIEMKKGFTMIELLVVVSIMGILSTMGIASLHAAVVNNRVRDAAVNVTAYLERVASEANRLSDTVCVKAKSSKDSIIAYKGSCSSNKKVKISGYGFEKGIPLKFDNSCTYDGSTWNLSTGVPFVPKFGLSAAPVQGCVIIPYSTGEKKALAVKKKDKNNIVPQVSYDSGSSWMDP